jgi:DNA-directed RNA polymerase subunit M/transcription elongation factor TFIIS
MLEIICPRCGNVHHADEIHVDKMLRCAKCGDAVQIGSRSAQNSLNPTERSGSSVGKPFKESFKTVSKKKNLLIWAFASALICLIAIVIANEVIKSNKKAEHISDRVARENAEERQRLRAENELARPVDDLHSAPITNNSKQQVDEFQTHRTLPSGTRIRLDIGTYGRGILIIANYANSDALVKIISASRGRTMRYVFVQQNSKVTLNEIPQGTYKVRFCFGDDWDSRLKHFTNTYSFFEFGDKLTFDETREDDGVEYTRQEITLHTVPNGNVPRKEIEKTVFDSEGESSLD